MMVQDVSGLQIPPTQRVEIAMAKIRSAMDDLAAGIAADPGLLEELRRAFRQEARHAWQAMENRDADRLAGMLRGAFAAGLEKAIAQVVRDHPFEPSAPGPAPE